MLFVRKGLSANVSTTHTHTHTHTPQSTCAAPQTEPIFSWRGETLATDKFIQSTKGTVQRGVALARWWCFDRPNQYRISLSRAGHPRHRVQATISVSFAPAHKKTRLLFFEPTPKRCFHLPLVDNHSIGHDNLRLSSPRSQIPLLLFTQFCRADANITARGSSSSGKH